MSKKHKYQNNNYNEVENEHVDLEDTNITSNDNDDLVDTISETEESSKTQDEEEIVVDNSTNEDDNKDIETTNFDSIDITPSDDIYDENEDITEEAIDNFIDSLEKEHENNNEISDTDDSKHSITDDEIEQMFSNEDEIKKAQEQQILEKKRLKEEHDKQIQQEIIQEQERIAASTPNVQTSKVNKEFVTKKFTIRFGYNSNNVRATSEKTVDLVELFDLFIKYRSALYGLTSMDSYKEISEFMKNEKFIHNNTEIEENGKKQFLQKLYTNTVLIVKMLNK